MLGSHPITCNLEDPPLSHTTNHELYTCKMLSFLCVPKDSNQFVSSIFTIPPPDTKYGATIIIHHSYKNNNHNNNNINNNINNNNNNNFNDNNNVTTTTTATTNIPCFNKLP